MIYQVSGKLTPRKIAPRLGSGFGLGLALELGLGKIFLGGNFPRNDRSTKPENLVFCYQPISMTNKMKWNCFFEFFIRENVSLKNFPISLIWPLRCLYKALKIVFFLLFKIIATQIDSASSEFRFKSFHILNSKDWWIFSETPPLFFLLSHLMNTCIIWQFI